MTTATNADVLALAVAGNLEGVRALVERDPALATVRNQFGTSPIHAAHYSGHPEIVELLLASGVDLDIFLAAQLDMTERVETLLRAEPALVRARNAAGSTVLHGAVYWGAHATAELLLRAGAEVNAAGTSGLRIAPLGSAVASPDVPNPSRDQARVVSLVLLLLSYGADPSHRRSDGMTALHTAAYRGHLDVMRALLVAGADATIAAHKDGGPHSGETPEASARSQGHLAAVELLKEYAARRGNSR